MSKRVDALILAFLLVLAVVISLWANTTFLTSIGLFLGLPALWLSFRKPESITKLLLLSVAGALPFFIITDFLAALNGVWYVPTIFPFRVWGAAFEDFIWLLALIYLTTIFYEYFLDRGKDKIMWKHMKWLFLLSAFLLVILGICALLFPAFLHIPYTYLFIGLVFILCPSIFMLSFFPKLSLKFFATLIYFFPLAAAMEVTALKLHHWEFPGKDFIGWVNLFGYQFPFEELFFWFFLLPIAILSYYEYFDDDQR